MWDDQLYYENFQLYYENLILRKQVMQLKRELQEERRLRTENLDLILKGEAMRGRLMLDAILGKFPPTGVQ